MCDYYFLTFGENLRAATFRLDCFVSNAVGRDFKGCSMVFNNLTDTFVNKHASIVVSFMVLL